MLLYIVYVWPEPGSSAAGVRTVSALRAARRVMERHSSQVLVASSATNEAARKKLTDEGFETLSIQLNDSSFDELVQTRNPDIVVFDRFVTEEQYGARVRKRCPKALRVVDTQDFHALRALRLSRTTSQGSNPFEVPNPSELWGELLRQESCLRELASFARSDQVWLVSQAERELFSRLLQGENLMSRLKVLPFGYSAPFTVPGVESRQGFTYGGNFRHAPNRQALATLLERVWPELRRRLLGDGLTSHAKLSIYGAYPDAASLGMIERTEGASFGGWVDDLGSHFGKHLGLIAPLGSGAGIKGKILLSASHGTPVLSTPVGLEGIDLTAGTVCTGSFEQMTQLAHQWAKSSEAWTIASSEARRVGELFSERRSEELIEEQVELLMRSTNAPRTRDWLTEMVWSQTLRSTEYFSRWIELKEKHEHK